MVRSRTEPQAFGVLTERYGRKIYNFLLRFTQEPAVAEDLLQQTFLKAFQARESYQPRGSFVAWVFSIARNLAYSRARAARRSPVVALYSGRDDPARAVPDPAPGPEEQAVQREDRQWIRAAVKRLPPGQREVLLLSRYHAMSYQQIAEIVGTTADAVKQKAHRAVQTLRAWYAGEEWEDRADDRSM